MLNYGGRWNFSKRTRLLVTGQLFDISIGDYSGRLDDTQVFAEFLITKNFGIGGGFERSNFEIDAEDSDFQGEVDSSCTALALYLKGQF